MNSFCFGDAELFSPPLIGQFIKDSFSDETIFQEHETFFWAFFTSKMNSVPPLTVGMCSRSSYRLKMSSGLLVDLLLRHTVRRSQDKGVLQAI